MTGAGGKDEATHEGKEGEKWPGSPSLLSPNQR